MPEKSLIQMIQDERDGTVADTELGTTSRHIRRSLLLGYSLNAESVAGVPYYSNDSMLRAQIKILRNYGYEFISDNGSWSITNLDHNPVAPERKPAKKRVKKTAAPAVKAKAAPKPTKVLVYPTLGSNLSVYLLHEKDGVVTLGLRGGDRVWTCTLTGTASATS